ncbi:MAG: flagellar biosynthetic protein FliQ [Pirellulaceae bacterium]
MDPQIAIDIARQSVHAVLWLSAPVLAVALLVGLIVGIMQAMTQVHDQTVLFVAKLVATVIVISICLPWFIEHYTGFSRDLIEQIPETVFDQTPR